MQFPYGLTPDSPTSLFPHSLTGTSQGLRENYRSPAPATWVSNSPWDEPTPSTTTKLSSILSDKILFTFKLKHVAIRLSSYYRVYLHSLYLNRIFSNFDEFVCQQKHQHDISGIRWGMELKISSFEFFNSFCCLNTSILYITRNVTWLHHITFHGWQLEEIPAWKQSC